MIPERHGIDMSYRDDLDAAVRLNDALRSELDRAKTSAKPAEKKGFASRYPTLVTLLILAGYLFTSGIFYTAWRTPHMMENHNEIDMVKTGFLSLMWPVTLTWKLGSGLAGLVVDQEKERRSRQ